jgi:hypothetical protein
MPNPQLRAEVPEPTGDGLTPHTLTELMSTDRDTGGFRLLFPPTRSISGSTLVYVVDHGSTGGYRFTVISENGVRREISLQDYKTDIEPRSQGIDPPEHWPDLWERYESGGVMEVQHELRKIRLMSKSEAEQAEVVGHA